MTGQPPEGEPEPLGGEAHPTGEADTTGEARPTGEAVDEVDEDEVDEASEESFPASDAPASWSGPPDS